MNYDIIYMVKEYLDPYDRYIVQDYEIDGGVIKGNLKEGNHIISFELNVFELLAWVYKINGGIDG